MLLREEYYSEEAMMLLLYDKCLSSKKQRASSEPLISIYLYSLSIYFLAGANSPAVDLIVMLN
jgi:hypothetical protein